MTITFKEDGRLSNIWNLYCAGGIAAGTWYIASGYTDNRHECHYGTTHSSQTHDIFGTLEEAQAWMAAQFILEYS
jgi:hypothetical protein